MSSKLIIPRVVPDRLPIRWELSLRKRGAEGRRIQKQKLDRLIKNREARMWVVMICAVIWGLFWFQFVTGVLYEMPAIYTLSGGNWVPPDIDFYNRDSELSPWSLAGDFVAISIFASVLGLAAAWWNTQGVQGKWRMRFVVLLFSTIVCGWSIAALKAEDGVWIRVENQISKTRRIWRDAAQSGEEEWLLRRYRLEVERLEALLKTRP